MRYEDMEAWRRVARAVAARRAELRLNQGDLHGRGGPSLATVQSIESARNDTYRDRTLLDLERALEWGPGSITSVLQGGEPLPLASAPTPRVADSLIAAVWAAPDLLPESKQHLVAEIGLLRRVRAESQPTPEEARFLAQGQADVESAATGLRVVDNPGSCQ